MNAEPASRTVRLARSCRPATLLLALAIALSIALACRTVPPAPTTSSGDPVECLDNLTGQAGEFDNALYRVRLADRAVDTTTVVVLRLPGVFHPDGVALRPQVTATVGGRPVTVAPGNAWLGKTGPMRTLWDTPIAIPPGIEGDVVEIRVERYRLPLRSVERLPVGFFGDFGPPAGTRLLGACPGAVRAGPPVAVLMDAPSFAEPGQALQIRFQAVDAYGNPAGDPGPMSLEIGGERPKLPPVRANQNGAGVVRWTPPTEGVYRLSLVAKVNGEEQEIGAANPIVVPAETKRPGSKLLWGDLHSHTGFSDAFTTAGPAEALAYARDVTHLDFAAVTDHLEPIWGPEMSADRWAAEGLAAETYNAPGAFTAFRGYEWTSSFPQGGVKSDQGHAHVIFEAEAVRCAAHHEDCATFELLVERLKPMQPLIIPHHLCVNWAPFAYRRDLDLSLSPAVEIVSSHGACECLDGPGRPRDASSDPLTTVRAALLEGERFNLLGGSDNHLAHPGARRFPHMANLELNAGGLTAVWAEDNTRAAILKAIRYGRTYATTGARIALQFSGHGEHSGWTNTGGKFEIHGTNKLAEVTLWRGDLEAKKFEALWRLQPNGMDVAGRWTDEAPVAPAVYYLRVIQADGEMAWSNLVWTPAPVIDL